MTLRAPGGCIVLLLVSTNVQSSAQNAPAAVSLPAQDTAIKGARLSLVSTGSAVLNVTIENRRDSPLLEVEMGVTQRGAGKGSLTSTRYFRETPPGEAVKPNERRVLETKLGPDFDAETATLSLVVFQDGYYEGVAAAVEPWRKKRQARVDDLRYWDGVFEVMPQVSEPDLRSYLASHMADRAGHLGQDPSGMPAVIGRLQDVLRRYPSGPEVWAGIGRLRAEMKRELTALTRQPDGDPPARVGPVTAVAIVSQERVSTKTVMAAIENLRAVPIEAFGLEILEPGTNRGRAGQASDFCLTESGAAQPGQGRIQPHETREIPLTTGAGPDGTLPQVRLSFLIFDDLTMEGRAADRNDLLRRRERQAEDYAFAIAALSQVAARPAAEVHSFLVAKRVERVKQLQAAGARDTHMPLDELIREAKESPERMLANATAMQERYEWARQRLARHVRR